MWLLKHISINVKIIFFLFNRIIMILNLIWNCPVLAGPLTVGRWFSTRLQQCIEIIHAVRTMCTEHVIVLFSKFPSFLSPLPSIIVIFSLCDLVGHSSWVTVHDSQFIVHGSYYYVFSLQTHIRVTSLFNNRHLIR